MSRKTFYLIAGGVVVLILLGCIGSAWIVEVPFYLTFGWIWHVGRVVPKLTVNVGGIVLIVLCVTAAAWLGHGLATWLAAATGARPWRWRWTMLGMLSILLMFTAGVAATGVVHQTGWLINSPMRLLARNRLSNRVKCASNMRMIAIVIHQYQQANAGARPPSFEALVHEAMHQDSGSEIFVCPDDILDRAPGPTTRQMESQILSDHSSFVYVPAGIRDEKGGQTIILYEPLTNHYREGMNVMFDDLHVEWMVSNEADRLLTRATTQSASSTPPSPVHR